MLGRIQDHSAASSSSRLAPLTEYWARLCHLSFLVFSTVWLTVFHSSFDLGLWPSISMKKAYKVRDCSVWISRAVFRQSFFLCVVHIAHTSWSVFEVWHLVRDLFSLHSCKSERFCKKTKSWFVSYKKIATSKIDASTSVITNNLTAYKAFPHKTFLYVPYHDSFVFLSGLKFFVSTAAPTPLPPFVQKY